MTAPASREYLVVMTTHVPDGTAEQAVTNIREREAARSRELAAEGHLLRLWRPPLEPGEWRTLGLFAAGDDAELEDVLASMPLRVWRTDRVTPLLPHPNDTGRGHEPQRAGREFLALFTVTIPADAPGNAVEAVQAAEAARARELARTGHLVRLWTLPGDGRALGLYQAGDSEEMDRIVQSLPLRQWMTTKITPLTPHPSDPASSAGAQRASA
jgi:muconolactone delta-isomerase